jgi:secreted PhoX family phosphatase
MTVQDEEDFAKMTPELVGVEMMAHGGSVVEIQKIDGQWRVIKDSPFNRRLRLRPRWKLRALQGVMIS